MNRIRTGWTKTLTLTLVFCVALPVTVGGACSERGNSTRQRAKTAPPPVERVAIPKDRGALERLTWKTLRDAPALRKLASSIPALRRALQREPLSQEDDLVAMMLMENVCGRRLNWPKNRHGMRDWYRAVWKACGVKGSNLISAQERNRWGVLAVWVATLHGLLRRAKVSPPLARALSRVWLRPHPRMAQARQGVSLPKVPVDQALAHQSLLTITKTKLFLDGRVLPVSRKGAGIDAPDRLTKGLAALRAKTSKLHKGARNHLALIAAAKMPFSVIRHVLASASSAGYDRVHLVARGSSDEPGILEVYTRTPFKKSSQIPALGLSLKVAAKGYFVYSRFGPECQPDAPEETALCLPLPAGGYTPAVKDKLALHLWWLFASKYKDPSSYANPKARFQLIVTADDTVSFGDVLHALAAVVTIPPDAKIPPVRHKVSPSGCRRDYDPKSQSWKYPYPRVDFRENNCMYDLRVLR